LIAWTKTLHYKIWPTVGLYGGNLQQQYWFTRLVYTSATTLEKQVSCIVGLLTFSNFAQTKKHPVYPHNQSVSALESKYHSRCSTGLLLDPHKHYTIDQ